MNKKQIDKNKVLNLFYKYMLESNDDELIFLSKISKQDYSPTVYFGIHNAEYRFYADKKNNQLKIKSYFTNHPDNYQIYTIGIDTAPLLNIQRSIYDMIISKLIENNYL
jgi:hypothetical protein